MKVAIVLDKVAPYRVPLFNRLHEAPEIQLKVFSLVDQERHRQWHVDEKSLKFDHELIPGWNYYFRPWEFSFRINWGIGRALDTYRPDVVIISGYSCLGFLYAAVYCRIHRIPYIFWNGTTLLSTRTTRGIVGEFKRFVISRADQYITYGTMAADYLEYMGAPKAKIHIGLNTVDMDWYRKESLAFRERESFIKIERSKYPLLILLYVGQLIPRKNVRGLVETLKNLQDSDLGLFIVGSGPQEAELKRYCRRYAVRNIYFEGFKQQPELPYYYALADVLVLPSLREVWGLVVNLEWEDL